MIGASELTDLKGVDWPAHKPGYLYLTAAGFEPRARRGPDVVARAVPLVKSFVLEFRDKTIPQNAANLQRIKTRLMRSGPVAVCQHHCVGGLEAEIRRIVDTHRCRVIVDVTAMTHALILESLEVVRRAGTIPLVLYTEAREYYPTKHDAMKYLKYPDDERAFHAASRYEGQAVMYAGLSSVGTVSGFEGRILPTAPTTVILFPTFKRLRTAAMLAELEVRRKVFMLGVPVRADLRWRERALRVINYDLINSETDLVLRVDTLSAGSCYRRLCALVADGTVSPRGNIVVCPHGSKMQTVGVWLFCTENPEVRVAVAHPREFFPGKYSAGFGATFVFDPGAAGSAEVSSLA